MRTIEINVYTIAECGEKIKDCESQIERDRRLPESKWKRFCLDGHTAHRDTWTARKEYCDTHRVDEVALYEGRIIDHTDFEEIKRLLEE